MKCSLTLQTVVPLLCNNSFCIGMLVTSGIVGVVKVVKEYYPDSTQFDEKVCTTQIPFPDFCRFLFQQNPHYDPKSDPDDPRWGMVDVQVRWPPNAALLLCSLFGISDGQLLLLS